MTNTRKKAAAGKKARKQKAQREVAKRDERARRNANRTDRLARLEGALLAAHEKLAATGGYGHAHAGMLARLPALLPPPLDLTQAAAHRMAAAAEAAAEAARAAVEDDVVPRFLQRLLDAAAETGAGGRLGTTHLDAVACLVEAEAAGRLRPAAATNDATAGLLDALGRAEPRLSLDLLARAARAAGGGAGAAPGASRLLELAHAGDAGQLAGRGESLVLLLEALAGAGANPGAAAAACDAAAAVAACPSLRPGLADLFALRAGQALAIKGCESAAESLSAAVGAVVAVRPAGRDAAALPAAARDGVVEGATDALGALQFAGLTAGRDGGEEAAAIFMQLVSDLVAMDTEPCLRRQADGRGDAASLLQALLQPLLRRAVEHWSHGEQRAQASVFRLRHLLYANRLRALVMERWRRDIRPALLAESARDAPEGEGYAARLAAASDRAADQIAAEAAGTLQQHQPRGAATPASGGASPAHRRQTNSCSAQRAVPGRPPAPRVRCSPKVALVFADNDLPTTEGNLQRYVFNARLNIDVFAHAGGYDGLSTSQKEQCGPGRFAIPLCAHRTYRFNKGAGYARLCGRMLLFENGGLAFRVFAHGDHTEVYEEYLLKGILGMKALDAYRRAGRQKQHQMRLELSKNLPDSPEFERVPFASLEAYLEANRCRAAHHYDTQEEFGDPANVRAAHPADEAGAAPGRPPCSP